MKKNNIAQPSRSSMDDTVFVNRHKRSDQDFTRDRILTFRALAVLLLTKGTKSLQLRMNTFLPKLGRPQATVDKSAYSRARQKLKHTAFIELNQEAVVATMYDDGDYQTWQGHRVLAIDGSKLQLPDTPSTVKASVPGPTEPNTKVVLPAPVLWPLVQSCMMCSTESQLMPVWSAVMPTRWTLLSTPYTHHR